MTKYKKVTPEIAAQLQAIVGAKRFFAGDAVKDDFSHDEMPIYGKYYPEVVCEAESTEEVSAILRVCYENDIPVTPRGAGTGLVGGCVPLCGGVVLCTTRMNKILSYDMNNLVVHIQPGVLLCDLAADALTRGLMYPPDPGEKTATVGGNVSTNAGGMRAVKYGVTRDYVLAMTVVLPDGRVMELGKTVCKTSSGYSLLHLMIGSEGTLGVITELTLKLIPKPEMNVSLILPFADVETAIASVPQIKLANLDPQSIEFMERDIVDSSAAFTGNTIFPTVVDGKEAGAYILVTLVGDSEAELTAKMDRLGALAEQRGAYDTLVVWTDGLKKDRHRGGHEAARRDGRRRAGRPHRGVSRLHPRHRQGGGHHHPQLRPRGRRQPAHLLLRQRHGARRVQAPQQGRHGQMLCQVHRVRRAGLRRTRHRPRKEAVPGGVRRRDGVRAHAGDQAGV